MIKNIKIHDLEVSQVMSEIQEDYFPGMVMMAQEDALKDTQESEIDEVVYALTEIVSEDRF